MSIQEWLDAMKYRISFHIFKNDTFDAVIQELEDEKHICQKIRCPSCHIFLGFDYYCSCYTEMCYKCNTPCKPEEILHDHTCSECWSEIDIQEYPDSE